MSELQILFDVEEIAKIENIIADKMNRHIEEELRRNIQKQLGLMIEEQFEMYGINMGDMITNESSWSGSEEMAICGVFWEVEKRHRGQVSALQEQINGLNDALANKQKSLQELKGKNQAKTQQISHILDILSAADKKNVQLQHTAFRAKEVHLMQQSQIESLRYQLQLLTLNGQRQTVQKDEKIEGLNEQINRLTYKIDLLKEQNGQLLHVLGQMETELIEEVQTRKCNFVTYTIEANQLQEQYSEWINMHTKMAKIHQQNRSIVQLLTSIQQKFTHPFKLESIESSLSSYQYKQLPLQQHFSAQMMTIQSIKNNLEAYSSEMNSFFQQFKLCKAYVVQLQAELKQQKRSHLKSQQNIEQLTVKNKDLNDTINSMTKSNYQVLLELTQGKQFVEKQLTHTKEELKKKQEQMNKVKDQMEMISEQVQKLREQVKQLRAVNHDLEDHYTQVKKSISSIIFQQNEQGQNQQNSQKQLMQNMLERQATLVLQLTTLKASFRHLQQSKQNIENTYQKRNQQLIQMRACYEEAVGISSTLREQCQQLQELINVEKQCVSQKEESIQQLKKQIDLLKIKKESEDKMVQTEDICQIKRQNVLNRSTKTPQNSLSLPDKQKQNTSRQNLAIDPKFKLKHPPSCPQSCPHLQKIAVLNQLLNYMMNHIKGYQGNSIRPGSWFTHQISKYGFEYKMKITDQHHLATKMKNKKIVSDLCNREQTVDRLVREFQGIMEYYFSKGDDSVMGKEEWRGRQNRQNGKLNKTVAKMQKGGAMFSQSRQLYR